MHGYIRDKTNDIDWSRSGRWLDVRKNQMKAT